MAYQKTIIKCAKRFEGLGWIAYDMYYRRTAAQTKYLNWGIIDQSAYAEWFTGKSKAVVHCGHCLEEHATQDCPQTSSSILNRLAAPILHSQLQFQPSQSAQFTNPTMVLPGHKSRPQSKQPWQQPKETPICGLFNSHFGNRCTLAWCTYRHICSQCRGAHSRTQYQPMQYWGHQSSQFIGPPPAKRFTMFTSIHVDDIIIDYVIGNKRSQRLAGTSIINQKYKCGCQHVKNT